MTATRTSPPTAEPISTAEAKAHLRVDHSSEDTLIDGLVRAAREFVEDFTGRALISQTWQLTLDGFPAMFRLEHPPIASITSLQYVDSAGATQTVDAADYVLDGADIRKAYGVTWPTPRAQPQAVTVTYVAGYGDAGSDVPMPLRMAMYLLLSSWFTQREGIITGTIAMEAPLGVKALISPYIWK